MSHELLKVIKIESGFDADRQPMSKLRIMVIEHINEVGQRARFVSFDHGSDSSGVSLTMDQLDDIVALRQGGRL